jgi:hypothetical protein|tara:strand:- start:2089 stop:2904 length:816 start_codon:yes stop_codon:yes gene_type:complete
MVKKTHLSSFAFALSLMTCTAAAQETNPDLDATWQFSAYALFQTSDASVSSTGILQNVRTLDLEDLGMDDSTVVPQLSVKWRFSDRWVLNFAYSDFSLDGRQVIDSSFDFGDTTFPLNASLKTELSLAAYVVALDYVIFKSDQAEFGIGAGLHGLDLDLQLDGDLSGLPVAESQSDFLAPLPNLRAFGRYAITPKIVTTIQIGWMGADIDDYSGDFLVASAGVRYQFSQSWSVGLNYQITHIDFEVGGGRNEEVYDMELDGIAVSMRYSIK